jgi:predicted enzyme related to lactoylglutathione lyase
LRALIEIVTWEANGQLDAHRGHPWLTMRSAGNYVMIVDPDRVQPKLLLQEVPESKTVKNRMHLDIETPDVDSEASRLESLGARRLEAGVRSEHGTSWVIMADPENNEFCVCDGGAS